MKKAIKNILLTLSTGLAITGISVPMVTVATSCSSERNDDRIELTKILGKYVFWTTGENYTNGGLLVKVEDKKIWMDALGIDGYDATLIAHELPLVASTFTIYPNIYITQKQIIASFEKIKKSLWSIDSSLILKKLQIFTEQQVQKEAKIMLQEITEIFKSDMMGWTVEKMDEVVDDVAKNNSLKKWSNLTSYYLNSFVWGREKVFEKINYMNGLYGINIPSDLILDIKALCDLLFEAMVNYGMHIHILPK